MKVLEKSWYKLKPMEITAMKVLKTFILIKHDPPPEEKVCEWKPVTFHE